MLDVGITFKRKLFVSSFTLCDDSKFLIDQIYILLRKLFSLCFKQNYGVKDVFSITMLEYVFVCLRDYVENVINY